MSALGFSATNKQPILPITEPPKAYLPAAGAASPTTATSANRAAEKALKQRSCVKRVNWKIAGPLSFLAVAGTVLGPTIKKLVIDPQNAAKTVAPVVESKADQFIKDRIATCLDEIIPSDTVSLMSSSDPNSPAVCGIFMRDGKAVSESGQGAYGVYTNFHKDASGRPYGIGITDKSSTTWEGKEVPEWDGGWTREIPCRRKENTDALPPMGVSAKIGEQNDFSVDYTNRKPVNSYAEGNIASGDGKGVFTYTNPKVPSTRIVNLRGTGHAGRSTFRQAIEAASPEQHITMGDATLAYYGDKFDPKHQLKENWCSP